MLADKLVDEAVAAVRLIAAKQGMELHGRSAPQVALILGSGWGGVADDVDIALTINYADIPQMQVSGVPGHNGRLLFGKWGGKHVVCMQGRLHGYEGNTPEQIILPVQIMAALGAETLIVTNASGAINTDYRVGSVVAIRDHINFTGSHPLTFGQRGNVVEFTDMTHAYTPKLVDLALQAASDVGVEAAGGIFLGVRGPSFETPAEIRAFRAWGADCVAMSTIFEVICARALSMDVLGLSLISNMAAGVLDEPLTLDHITAVAERAKPKMAALLAAILAKL